MQPVVQQFDIPKFDIHEDRSMSMAINTKKNYEIAEVRSFPEDKENANSFPPPPVATQQVILKVDYLHAHNKYIITV